MKGNKCAGSEESIDTNDNFRHSANVLPSPNRDPCAKSTRRNVRTAKRAQERERSSLQISYRSGVQEARVSKTCATLRPYILRPFCLRIHSFSSISRIISLALARSHSRIYLNPSIFYFIFFSFLYSAQPYGTPYGSRVALGRHMFPRIGRIRNYPTAVASNQRFQFDRDVHRAAIRRWQLFKGETRGQPREIHVSSTNTHNTHSLPTSLPLSSIDFNDRGR